MIHALAITGPTASGKTALSIEVARRLGCEIISLDSMQIYRGMDIGTAKATAEERAAVPHHMIDLLPPGCDFSAKQYKDMALDIAADIEARGKIPLFAGGTGLYLSTLIRPECEAPPESVREYRDGIMSGIATEEDRIRLWERLSEVDPESAAATHHNNVRRVIRALEIYDATGKTKTYFDRLSQAPSDRIEVRHVTLDFHNRDTLYRRIDARVDEMLSSGLMNEVRDLVSRGELLPHTTAAQAIGYKELLCALRGEASLEDAVLELKQASRNYAKRQLTWFRNNACAEVLYCDTEGGDMIPLCELCRTACDYFLNTK